MIELRPYQIAATDQIRDAYRAGKRSPVLVSPTGSGKTVIFGYVAQNAAAKGKRVLILAHRRELIRQASRKLAESGVPHGIISPGFTPNRELVQVASVQTLARRLNDLPSFDLIVIDEAHHAVAGQWARIIEAQPGAKLLGVTATPERLDGRGLGVSADGCFDEMVLGPRVGDLIDGGFLTPARVYAPAHAPDLSGVRIKGGDFASDQLEERINVATITGDVLAHWRRLANGLPTIAFCISVQHAENVAATFRMAGIRAVCGHGGLSPSDRDAAIAGLANGKVQVLTTCDLVSEGLDVPAVGAVILLRPTKSLGLYLQQVGRGLRPAPGKQHLLVLDHAGCTMIHGLPEEDRAWSLQGRPKGAKPPQTWQCSACFAIQKPARICIACGSAEEVDDKKKGNGGREIIQADGELVEVDRTRMEHLRAAKLADILTGRETKEQLQEIARAKGYHHFWVYKTLQERRARAA